MSHRYVEEFEFVEVKEYLCREFGSPVYTSRVTLSEPKFLALVI